MGKQARPRGPRLGLVAALATLAGLLSASPAAANHVPGFYSGTHADGGVFNLQLTPDGTGVSYITAQNVLGSSCTFNNPSDTYVPPVPVILDYFQDSSYGAPGFTAYGNFTQGGNASGYFRVYNDITMCDSGTVAWSAHNSGAPAPHPGDDDDGKKDDEKTCRKKGAKSAKKKKKKKGCGKKKKKKKKK